MTEHTPTPWNAASKYSSVVGVPIVNQQGKRIGNTALPDMPPEWDHLKRQAEIDAAFIVKAVNNHRPLVDALKFALEVMESYAFSAGNDPRTATPESAIGRARDAIAHVSRSGDADV